MGAMTAVMVGLGATSAVTQVVGGMQQKDEAEQNASAIRSESAYNAGVYRQQAGMVEQQKQLKAAQDARQIRFVEGQHTAVTAAKGLEMSGSAMAVLSDTLTQMEMDKAITGYNYDMDKYRLESQAVSTERRGMTLSSQYRSKGKNAMTAGIVGGMATFAGSMFQAAAYNYTPKKINTGGPGGVGTVIKTTSGYGYRHDGQGNFGGLI